MTVKTSPRRCRASGVVIGPCWLVKQEKNNILHILKGLRVEILFPCHVILIVKRNIWQVAVTDKNSALLWSRWEVLMLRSVLQPWPLPIKCYLYIVRLFSLHTLPFKIFQGHGMYVHWNCDLMVPLTGYDIKACITGMVICWKRMESTEFCQWYVTGLYISLYIQNHMYIWKGLCAVLHSMFLGRT